MRLLLLPLPACLPLEGQDTMDLKPGWRWVTDRETSLDGHMSPRGAWSRRQYQSRSYVTPPGDVCGG